MAGKALWRDVGGPCPAIQPGSGAMRRGGRRNNAILQARETVQLGESADFHPIGSSLQAQPFQLRQVLQGELFDGFLAGERDIQAVKLGQILNLDRTRPRLQRQVGKARQFRDAYRSDTALASCELL